MTHKILAVSLLFALSPFNAYSEGNTAAEELNGVLPASDLLIPPPAAPAARRSQAADLTAEYLALSSGQSLPRAAEAFKTIKDYKVLLIPGFLADRSIISFNTTRRLEDFHEQIKWLRELGVEYEKVKIDSKASIKTNSRFVTAAIEASEKPVIIVAHSKGGLDALDALVKDRTLVSMVRGIVTFQTPYYGSPVADYVMKHSLLQSMAIELLAKIGGNKEGMVNLGSAERIAYLKANAAAIAEITALTPVLTLATWKDETHNTFDTPLELFRDEMLEHGIKSDGVVPLDSAVLPGADFVKLEGVDHSTTVRQSDYISLDRINLTKTLLTMVLSR